MKNLTKKQKNDLCLQCGECCKVLIFSFPSQKRELITGFYEARGLNVFIDEGAKLIHIEVSSVCPNLTSFGCKIYPERPEACRNYDPKNNFVIRSRCLWYKEKGGVK